MNDELTRQMEMVQMLQMQFMSIDPSHIFKLVSGLYPYLGSTRQKLIVDKLNSIFLTESPAVSFEDQACIAVTLALHLAGVEE